MVTTLWHLKYLLCVSQERSSSRRPNCVGTVLTPPAWQTDCSSWTPAGGAIPRWTKSFTSPSCQGNTNFDEQSEQHKGRIHTHTHVPPPPSKKTKTNTPIEHTADPSLCFHSNGFSYLSKNKYSEVQTQETTPPFIQAASQSQHTHAHTHTAHLIRRSG